MFKKVFLIIASVIILLLIITGGVIFWHVNSMIGEMVDVRVERNGELIEYYSDYLTKVELEAEDGLQLHTWQFSRESPRGIIIMLHGMHGMDASSLLDLGFDFWEEGFEVFSLDMRAHGKSGGEEIGLGYTEVFDVTALLDWIKEEERYQDLDVFLFGFSMGGATAINTAAKREDVSRVISIASFSSFEENFAFFMRQENLPEIIISLYRPAIRGNLRLRYGLNPVENSPINNIEKIYPRPVLLIHGDQDDQIPLEQGKSLYEKSLGNSELYIAEGKGHFLILDLLIEESTRDLILGFLD